MASLDTVLLTGPGLTSFHYGVGVPGPGLTSFHYGAARGPAATSAFHYDVARASGYCWDALAQRLGRYLAPPFDPAPSTRLGLWLRAVARELSGCTETVSLLAAADGRGTGTFTVTVRFEPITGVTAAQRLGAAGQVLESYTVLGYGDRTITLAGVQAPAAGDRLRVTYQYEQAGVEVRVTEALAQLNLGTAEGEFLDRWGSWFAVPRLGDSELDGPYARRIMSTITASRNTKRAILTAVRALVGPTAYMVEGFEVNLSDWVYKPAGDLPWLGGSPDSHLVWGKTSRFLQSGASGGPGTFQVWVPSGSGYTTGQIQAVVDAHKASGTRGTIHLF